MRRAVVIVMDGCGAGAAPDHSDFGDGAGVATVKNVWEKCGGLHLPHLASCGFLEACGIASGQSVSKNASCGRLRELSKGKDSVTGHWEMMGIVTKVAFPTYPCGFPSSVVDRFEQLTGRKSLANKPASGTQVIEEFGEEHQRTGCPILYTSADSVFQVAAHTDTVPIEQLYSWCRGAREFLVAPDNVQRVIARPFTGTPGAYVRTEQRKDFPVVPPRNLVDEIGGVFGIGVVPELFGGRGFLPVRRTQSNREHEAMLYEALTTEARFIFANFEDFDMLYGHRSDPLGFGRALVEFDQTLSRLIPLLGSEDLLVLTADHGNDPTDASTDHTREYVPVCLVGEGSVAPESEGMFHVGATVAKHLGLKVELPLS